MTTTLHCRRLAGLFVVALLALAGWTEAAQGGPTLRFGPEGSVAVAGLSERDLEALGKVRWQPEQWTALLAVYVDRKQDPEATGQPAMLGGYAVEGGLLLFRPRYPLAKGVGYRVIFHPDRVPGFPANAEAVTTLLTIPKPPPAAPTVVAQIYPSGDVLPENQLRFYLHFSAPMCRGEAWDNLRLLDEHGKEMYHPFLALNEELWDADRTRFTLFLDPSRIKRGLQTREEAGPVLEAGKRYTLEIDRRWSDAQGEPLKETYRKTFRAAGPIEKAVDFTAWKLSAPKAGTRTPLAVTFPQSLDHGLLHSGVWVEDAQGRRVAGTITVTERETRWQFTPKDDWAAGTYRLVADTELEDLAGNNIAKPFEVDVFGPVQKEVKGETVRREFRVER